VAAFLGFEPGLLSGSILIYVQNLCSHGMFYGTVFFENMEKRDCDK